MSARLQVFLLLIWLSLSAQAHVQAQVATQVISSLIDDATPYFESAFTVLQDNSTITLDLRPTSGDLDTLVYLVDRLGNIIQENDDRARGDVSSLIVYPYAPAGQYRVIATRYGVIEGKTSGTFELTVDVRPTPSLVRESFDVSLEAIYADGFPRQPVQPRAEWTILAYYGADTDLEVGLLHDFKEFELAGGSRDDVRVLVLMDRSLEFSDASGNWDDVRLFEVGPSHTADMLTIDTAPLATFPDTDAADASATGERLAQYLVWGMTHYPAQRYAIAFGSHGAAWEGLIQDNRSRIFTLDGLEKYDLISLPQLVAALDAARQAVGVERFDLLINDACSMSSIEYYDAVAPFFALSLASPEVVVDPALNMTDLTALLRQDSADVVAVGKQLVDRYVDVDIRAFPSADIIYLTHSITDLRLFPPLVQAIEDFARVFNASPALYARALGEARRNAYTYGAFLGSQTKVDVGDLMRRLLEVRSAPPALRAAAANVLTTLDAARLYARNGGDPRLDGLSYYNIYFPQDVNFFRRRDYFEQTSLPEWGIMLRNYFSSVTPRTWQGADGQTIHAPIAPRVTITSVYPQGEANILTPLNVRAEVLGRNLASVTATYDQLQPDGTYIRLGQDRVLIDATDAQGNAIRVNDWRSGANIVPLYWDVMLPVVSDGVHSANELLVFTEEPSDDACVRRGVAFLEGYYRPPGDSTWNEVSIVFDIVRATDGQVGRVQRVISKSATSGALAAVTIPVGSDFVAFRSRVTPDGRISLELGTTYYKWPEGGLTYTFEPAPDGQYNFGVLVTAFGGATGFDSASFRVKNSGVPRDLRGDNNLIVGYTLRRPASWLTTVYNFDVVEYERSRNCDATQQLSVYYLSDRELGGAPAPSDPAVIAAQHARLLAWNATPPIAATIQGFNAAQFDFSYQDAVGRAWTGRGFSLYDQQNEFGMTFTAEVRQDVGGLDDIFALLRDQLHFASTDAYFEGRNWTRDFVFRDYGFYEPSYPAAWEVQPTGEGEWTYIRDPLDMATFFAYRFLPSDERSAFQVAQAVATQEVAMAMSNFNLIGMRAHGDNETWDVALYEGRRAGQAILGRVYASQIQGEMVVLWFETPDDDDGLSIITDVLELMADSFYLAQNF
ncbi:MAG: clostripain-related cysteine peptidase [Anaerolineae bacterium]|nr:clostripain-related cysteine peptidase [Anaerolineae bacterium]MDW8171613.1 clostripain-related cysteine peptidase [Anaerolineae bacterium]